VVSTQTIEAEPAEKAIDANVFEVVITENHQVQGPTVDVAVERNPRVN